MRVAIRRETVEGERRVSLVPESTKRLCSKGFETIVEEGAGAAAFCSDEEFRQAGAEVVTSASTLLRSADAIVQIHPPTPEQAMQLREQSILICHFNGGVDVGLVRALAMRGVTAVAVDAIPRTTSAQMMDVLSSQATAVGYQSVLLAATALPRFFPLLMTAAGTIPPAHVLVLGAGVAGLQAVGTARRLGAVVAVFDVRKAVREQVESLGARFVEFDGHENAEAEGGYARELSELARRRQTEAIAKQAATADVVLCMARVPGRRAPVLLSSDMVRSMRPGSVVVDAAADQGGNCELTRPGQTIAAHGVTIIGEINLASRMPAHASQMYSRNMERLLCHLAPGGEVNLSRKDEILDACLVTRDGEIRHPKLRQAVNALCDDQPDSANAGAA